MSRCTGHCCDPVTLGWDALDLGTKPNSNVHQDDLSWFLRLRFREWSEHGAVFDCSSFDRPTGNCLAYDNRPPVCSLYPYGRSCIRDGCTLIGRGCRQLLVLNG